MNIKHTHTIFKRNKIKKYYVGVVEKTAKRSSVRLLELEGNLYLFDMFRDSFIAHKQNEGGRGM